MDYYNDKHMDMFDIENRKLIVLYSSGFSVVDYLATMGKEIYALRRIDDPSLFAFLKNINRNTNIVVSDHDRLDSTLLSFLLQTFINTFAYYNNMLVRLETLVRKDFDNCLKYTNRVSIELSNFCNYAILHRKCPLHESKGLITLPSNLVKRFVDEIAQYNFNGVVSFHVYNEPMIDPRLMSFITYTKKRCPLCKTFVLTNGSNLTQEMVDDLADSGLDILEVSAYSEESFLKCCSLHPSIPYAVYNAYDENAFDNRMNIYSDFFNDYRSIPCYSVLNDIILTCDGFISLCCLDWKKEHVLGDYRISTLEDIILSPKVQSLHYALTQGKRELNICKNCSHVEPKRVLNFAFNEKGYRIK